MQCERDRFKKLSCHSYKIRTKLRKVWFSFLYKSKFYTDNVYRQNAGSQSVKDMVQQFLQDFYKKTHIFIFSYTLVSAKIHLRTDIRQGRSTETTLPDHTISGVLAEPPNRAQIKQIIKFYGIIQITADLIAVTFENFSQLLYFEQ